MKNNFFKIGLLAIAFTILAVPATSNAAGLTRQLELGMSGADVTSLQIFLAQDATIYPQGLVTGYFGLLTKAAVSNFQARNGIASVGRVGPVTLTAINSQMTNGMTSTLDTSAPLISNVGVAVAKTNAFITWHTNSLARGTVYYSTAPMAEYEYPHSVTISGATAMTDTALRYSQTVNVSGLQANTLYYYDIYVTDEAGNASMTMQSSFVTTQ